MSTFGAVEFLQGAAFRVRRSRQYKKELYRAFLNGFLNVVPKRFTAKELGKVAPDRVAFICKLKGHPSREFVVFRVRVTYENHVPILGAEFCHMYILRTIN